jgi:tyrosyl-tRNA synthetase
MSFTEFTYQLIQGYDFYHLNKALGCKLQMGGSDQWGNITTGTELVRRMNVHQSEEAKEAFALTCPLITKSDGSKFGKSEGGNIWLTADKTSVYKFYQFWLNVSDEDAEKYIKIFTFLDKETIDSLIKTHEADKGLRLLQKRLAEEVTKFVHNEEALEKAILASDVLFGKAGEADLQKLDNATFLELFEGVPQANLSKEGLSDGLDMVSFLVEKTNFLPSNKEARRALADNSISINKTKVDENYKVSNNNLINNQFVLLQRGKKNYFIVNFGK